MECLGGEGTATGVTSRCWNAIPDEELEELLPRKMAALQPKSSGSLRRRLLSAKLHQNCNAIWRVNSGSVSTYQKAECPVGDMTPLPSQHHHSVNTGSLWQRTQHIPSRPHIYPSSDPETLGKPFLAPEVHEKPSLPSQSLPRQLRRSAHPVVPLGYSTKSFQREPRRTPLSATASSKEPEMPPQYQSSRRCRFSIKQWRKRRNAGQEVTQSTPLLPKAAGDSDNKWSVHFTTQKQHQDLVFVPAKRRSGSAEDLSVCTSLLTQEHVSVEAHLRQPGPTHSPSSYGLLDHSEGTSSNSSWKNRGRKMHSASSNKDEQFFLNHIRPMTPLVLNPVHLNSSWDVFVPAEELAGNLEVEPNSRLPTPEEKMRWQSEAVPSDIVPINITGESFDRQASFKRTLSNVDSISHHPSKLSRHKTANEIPETINRKPDSSLGGPGQLSKVVPPTPSCTSPDQQKEEEKMEIIKLKQLSKRKIQAPKQEAMSDVSSDNHHSLHLDLSTRVLPQSISSSCSLPSTPSHSQGPERPLFLSSCSLTSIPVIESQSFNGLTPYDQYQDNGERWSYRPFSQSSSVQSGWTEQKWKEGCKPLLSSGRSSPAYPDTTSLYSEKTTSSQSLNQVKRRFSTSSSSSHSYTGRISLRKSKRPPPPPLRSDSLRRRPGRSKSSLTSSTTRQEHKTPPGQIFLDPWVPRGNAKTHQRGMTCNTNVAFEPPDLQATPTDESSSCLCHTLMPGSTALEMEMLTFTHISASNSSELQHLASPSSGYSSDSNTPLSGTPLSSPLTPSFPITPSPGVFSHPQQLPLTSSNISNSPVSFPVTLLHSKNTWTEGKQKPPVPERKSSLISSHSSTASLSPGISPEDSCKHPLLLLPSAPAPPPIQGNSSSEKSLIPYTYTQAPLGPTNPSLVPSFFNELSVASTSTTFSLLFTSLSPPPTSCAPANPSSVKPSLAPPTPPPLPSSWQLASATYGQLGGAQSSPSFSLPSTTLCSPPSSAKFSETSFQPSPSLSYSSKPAPPTSCGPSVAPLNVSSLFNSCSPVTYSTSSEELAAPQQTSPPIAPSGLPEALSPSSVGPFLPPLPLPPPLPPLFLPMACPPSSAKVSVSTPPPPPPLPHSCLPISNTSSLSATPFTPPISPSALFLHKSPLSSAKLSEDLSPQHLSLAASPLPFSLLPSSPQTSTSLSSDNTSTPCPFALSHPNAPVSHCSSKLSELPLHSSLRLSFTAPSPPPFPFSLRPSPPPYAYAVRQSSHHSIVFEQSSSIPQTSTLLLSPSSLLCASHFSSLSPEDHGESQKSVLNDGQPHCPLIATQALQDLELHSVKNSEGLAIVNQNNYSQAKGNMANTNNAYFCQAISDEKIKGPQPSNSVTRDVNPNDLSNIDVKIAQVSASPLVPVESRHDEDGSYSANRSTSVTFVCTSHNSDILVSKENAFVSHPDSPRVKMSSDKNHINKPCLQEEQETKLSAEKPQNPDNFCLAMSLDCTVSASNQKSLHRKENEIKPEKKPGLKTSHVVASLKENPKVATTQPHNHSFAEKPVLPKKPDLCILGVKSSPKAKPNPREKRTTGQATIPYSGLQASHLHPTKPTPDKALSETIMWEKPPMLHKKPNLNSSISRVLFRSENILEASKRTFETASSLEIFGTTTGKIMGTNSIMEDCCISEALSTCRNSWNIDVVSRPWKSMENLSTIVDLGTHEYDTQITVTGPCRTWNPQEPLLNCDPNTMTETMCTKPLGNSSILGNLKAPGSSTQTSCALLIKDKEENQKMEKRQTSMMTTLTSSEKKKARKKRKMRMKRQLLMMSPTFEPFPSSLSSSSSGDEHDNTDQTQDIEVIFTPKMSDSEVSCTGQSRSSLSSVLSTDSLQEDLSIPDLLIHEEVPEEEKREVGGNPDDNHFVSISADQMFDSGKPRTTEDLFVAIHRSKRRMLGRGDSFSSSTMSSSSPSIQNESTPHFQAIFPKKSMTSDSFKALLLRKGSRSDMSSRISAVERLCKAAPYLNANDGRRSTSLLLKPLQPFQEELLISSFTLNKLNPAPETPVSPNSSSFSWTLRQRYLRKSSSSLDSLSSPFIFFSSSGRPRSLTPPCSSSRLFAARCRLHAAPMTAIFEGKDEEEEEEGGFTHTGNCDGEVRHRLVEIS